MKLCRENFPSLGKSKLNIIAALIELLKKYDFQKITILQIAQEADLSRATVYNHFKSKEEMLKCYIYCMKTEFEALAADHQQPNTRDLALIAFLHWEKHITFINILLLNNLFTMLLDEFVASFNCTLIENKAKKLVNILFSNNEKTVVYYRSFVAAGLWMMLKCWVEGGMKETPLEMAINYEKFISNGLNE